jgi:putative nucleotidyltransferase with HDIG domain
MLWEHSFGAGLAARVIANSTRLVNEEEAFLGGLFHDIGKIILNSLDNQQFQVVVQKCYNEGISFIIAEQQVFSYNHAEVGGLVIKKWNFPAILMQAVLKHHSFDFAEDEDTYQVRLTCVVGLANMFCHKLGMGVREPEDDLLLHESVPARLLNLDDARIESLLEKISEAYEKDKSFFS